MGSFKAPIIQQKRGHLGLVDWVESYRNCRLCPRCCSVDRVGGNGSAKKGFCGQTHQMRVAYVGPHFGEEPPLTGTKGSGTIFFTGCSLRCTFCQNRQISQMGMGRIIGFKELTENVEEMILVHQVHNINFVTPDHFFPHIFHLVSVLRKKGFRLPMVYNLSGYQSAEILRAAEEKVDIYIPDFKYSDPSLAGTLSGCPDYPEVAIDAIGLMIRQKGYLDASVKALPLAEKGVMVRHLILPGRVENSINALSRLFLEFGRNLPLSIMSQYHPVIDHPERDLNRRISLQEFTWVYRHAIELGFRNLFVQFPDKNTGLRPAASPFLPDFSKAEPFR